MYDNQCTWFCGEAAVPLGRMLDALYEYGIEKFYLEFGNHAMEKLGYNPESIHLDSTSFHLHEDKYNEEPVRISITGKTEANKKRTGEDGSGIFTGRTSRTATGNDADDS